MSFSKEVKNELKKIHKKEDEEHKKIVRVAFLNSGLISEPEKDYSLQMIFKTEVSANYIKQILNEAGMNFKKIEKQEEYCLYLKNGDEISKFLAFIGANSAVLKFEETRVLKDMKNNVNRMVNCETANLNKTVSAAVAVTQDIKYLKKIKAFDSLDESLKDVAELRIKNPDATLQELGRLFPAPLGKSGVNHRLKKIADIANECRRNRG